jgi:hypothetical protein
MDKFLDRLKVIHKHLDKETNLATVIDLGTAALIAVLDASEMYQANPSPENLTAYKEIVEFYSTNIHR